MSVLYILYLTHHSILYYIFIYICDTFSIAADITDYESRNECSQIQMDKVIEEQQFKFPKFFKERFLQKIDVFLFQMQ